MSLCPCTLYTCCQSFQPDFGDEFLLGPTSDVYKSTAESKNCKEPCFCTCLSCCTRVLKSALKILFESLGRLMSSVVSWVVFRLWTVGEPSKFHKCHRILKNPPRCLFGDGINLNKSWKAYTCISIFRFLIRGDIDFWKHRMKPLEDTPMAKTIWEYRVYIFFICV